MIAFEDEINRTLDALLDPQSLALPGTIRPEPALPASVRGRVRPVQAAVREFYREDGSVHSSLATIAKEEQRPAMAGGMVEEGVFVTLPDLAARVAEARGSLRARWAVSGPKLAQAVIDSASAATSREGFAFRYPDGWPSTGLASDEAARQAILGNARIDARMLLDPMGEGYQMVQRMAAIAEHGGDALAYLLLATPWGENYLRSRFPGAQSPVLEWGQERVRLAPRLLSERDGEAWSALGRIERPMYTIAALVRQDLTYANQELGVVGGPNLQVPEPPQRVSGGGR